MIEILQLLSSRKVVITLALTGAAIAMIGSYLLRKGSRVPEDKARWVLRTGYAITWASVAAFIVAGFLVR